MLSPRLCRASSLVALAALAACTESPTPATLPVARPFAVVAAQPATGSELLLNQPIALTCSDDVDLSTADLTSVRFTVTDYGGNPVGEQPRGTFRLRAPDGQPEDSPDRRRVLEFTPAIGTSRHDGGLRLSRRYTIDLAASAPTSLRSARGRPLEQRVRL